MNNKNKIDLAVQRFKREEYSQAEKQFKEILKEDPDNANVIYNYFLCLVKTDKSKDALNFLYSKWGSVERSLFYFSALRNCALLEAQNKNFERSLRHLSAALDLKPDDIYLLNIKAYILEKQENYLEAYRQYARVLELEPLNQTALNGSAYLILQLDGEIDLAVDLIQNALKMDRGNPAYLDTAGLAMLKKGKKKEAKIFFEKALQILPGNIELKEHLRFLKEKDKKS